MPIVLKSGSLNLLEPSGPVHACNGIASLETYEIEEMCIQFNVHGSVHLNNILVYNPNKMHILQILFYLTTALHVSGVTITHLQEHKTTVTTASGNRYTVLLSAAIVEELELI